MPSNSKIIIYPGACLIVDGGKITNQGNQLWQGIELQGNYNLSQIPASNQGRLILRNGAVI